jgi:hypothetical protein
VLPPRPLSGEIAEVLDARCVPAADAGHRACALYVAGPSRGLTFLTLDRTQRGAARRLGFEV